MLSLLARSSAFSPLSLSPVLWLKADGVVWQDSARTTLATADGDPVGAWDDASGNGNHVLQATASKRPLLKTSGGATGTGSKRVLFDGVDDFLQLLSLNLGTSWMICLLTTRGGAEDYFFGAKAGGGGSLITGYSGDAEYYGSPPRLVIAATNAIPSGFHSVCVGANSGGHTTRLDGAAGPSDAAAAADLDGGVTVGADRETAAPLSGSISEVIAFSSYSAANLALLDAYLNGRR